MSSHHPFTMRSDLLELAKHLRQERLYVQNEKNQLQDLNEKVKSASERLAHAAWVAHQQRQNLDGLILSRPDSSPAGCCQRANVLEATQFQDAYKQLNYQEVIYSEFLRTIHEKPKLLAKCLTVGDKHNLPHTPEVVSTIFSGLYGNCLMPEDEFYVQQLLHYLMESQLSTANNPRKLLRQGNCAFSRLYKAFTEELFSAKLFLTSALYEPILSLLTDDEIFLDIDPSKAIIRFPPQDRLKKFGREGTPDFDKALRSHRAFITSKLEILTKRFISGIRSNVHCFPPSLARLIRNVYALLTVGGRLDAKEVNAVCIDIIFYLFICPAIVDPIPWGIIDTPISYIARSNLMQVAQILQVLAMWKWDAIDPRLTDLYSRFDKECVSSIIEAILASCEDDTQCETPKPDAPKLTRLAVLMTPEQLDQLIAFLRSVSTEAEDLPDLAQLLQPLPESLPNLQKKKQKTSSDLTQPMDPDTVLVIPVMEGHEPPGFLSEDLVMTRSRQASRVRMNLANLPGTSEGGPAGVAGSEENSSVISAGEVQEKRTRFSLSHDDGSIGNTSDNLEAISEAASNHSVGSSLEEEPLDPEAEDPIIDNYGTPSVSGRDTPSSQVTEGDELAPRNAGPEDRGQVRKNGEADLEEKFGRFEIKPKTKEQLGDETVSMVSDTWSTDVLASDTETLGESAIDEARPIDDELARNRLLDELVVPGSNLLDVVDTASEAWSMDVLASDTESLRLGELDNEDTASVARSDDTRFTDDTNDPPESETETTASSLKRGPSSESNLLRPSRAAAVEQWARQSGQTRHNLPRRGSDSSSGRHGSGGGGVGESILKKSIRSSQEGGEAADLSSHLSVASIASSEDSFMDGDKQHVVATASTGSTASAPSVPSELQRPSPSELQRPSTGAIPKSISFDKTAVHKNRDKSFFKSWKLPKIGKAGAGRLGGRNSKSAEDYIIRSSERLSAAGDASLHIPEEGGAPALRRAASDEPRETSDDILAKYRKAKEPATADLITLDEPDAPEPPDERLVIDPMNVEVSYAFQDAKRKLRMMLAEHADVSLLAELPYFQSEKGTKEADVNEIEWLLRVQLAEAINMQDRGVLAQLHETLRCVSLFDSDGCRRLVRSLKDDYRRRSPYVAYLVRCRQGLLGTLAHQERLLSRVEVDRRVCAHHLVSVCIRLFLERRESQMQTFVARFRETRAPDEKTSLTETFLGDLWTALEQDAILASASEAQMELARTAVERAVIPQIYMAAMYPNGEADVSRDEVLAAHIARLAAVITPNHRDLKIPRQYHYEQPWPSAQAEIRRLAAYKTPSDKVACVVRCSQIVMNLLSLSSSKSVPAADDFVPVMVFVIIKANPPSLLSTVQYIESFYGSRISGEDQYWFMQFAAAIEFIKTMDYGQ